MKNFINDLQCAIRSSQEVGFTLIEVIITLTIMSILSSILIVYTRSSELQIKILKDKASFIGALYHARSLATNTFQGEGRVCGYGIYIVDDRHYITWSDKAGVDGCKSANKKYDEPGEMIENVHEFSAGVLLRNFGEQDFLRSILFVPPDPTIVTVPEKTPGGQFRLILGSRDGQSIATIGVNKFGQVEPAAGY